LVKGLPQLGTMMKGNDDETADNGISVVKKDYCKVSKDTVQPAVLLLLNTMGGWINLCCFV